MKLESMKCKPCEGDAKPMNPSQAKRYMPMVPGWKLGKKEISREMKFKNFMSAIKFINKVAKVAEGEGHHPDINLHSWNKVSFDLSTHAIGGLSQNDFILAAKINKIKQ